MLPLFDRLREAVLGHTTRVRNRHFQDAAMAACALIAAADGTVSFSERVRLDQLLESLEALQAFDVHESVNLFNDYVAELKDHPESGTRRALSALHRMAEDPETAALLFRVACALTRADGEFSNSEKERLQSIADELNVPMPENI
jgi:tellurite resistance protein TerB